MISWYFEDTSSSCQPWYVCLICWTPNYCRRPSYSSFLCCTIWFCNVMQGVLYPHTCITPCISNTFGRKYRGCHWPSFVKTNCLLVKLVHKQHSCYASPNNGEFLDDSWDFFPRSCVFVTQIRSEFLTCLGALFQEYVRKVPTPGPVASKHGNL